MSENTTITLDGKEITLEQLQEKKNSLNGGERIIETAPGHYETISRMQG